MLISFWAQVGNCFNMKIKSTPNRLDICPEKKYIRPLIILVIKNNYFFYSYHRQAFKRFYHHFLTTNWNSDSRCWILLESWLIGREDWLESYTTVQTQLVNWDIIRPISWSDEYLQNKINTRTPNKNTKVSTCYGPAPLAAVVIDWRCLTWSIRKLSASVTLPYSSCPHSCPYLGGWGSQVCPIDWRILKQGSLQGSGTRCNCHRQPWKLWRPAIAVCVVKKM